jgi:hypothetical protein
MAMLLYTHTTFLSFIKKSSLSKSVTTKENQNEKLILEILDLHLPVTHGTCQSNEPICRVPAPTGLCASSRPTRKTNIYGFNEKHGWYIAQTTATADTIRSTAAITADNIRRIIKFPVVTIYGISGIRPSEIYRHTTSTLFETAEFIRQWITMGCPVLQSRGVSAPYYSRLRRQTEKGLG